MIHATWDIYKAVIGYKILGAAADEIVAFLLACVTGEMNILHYVQIRSHQKSHTAFSAVNSLVKMEGKMSQERHKT